MKFSFLKFFSFLIFFTFLLVGTVSAIVVDSDFYGVDIEPSTSPVISFYNYTYINSTNNSLYWDGNDWSDTRWLNLSGSNANQNISVAPYNFTAGTGFFDYLGSLANRITEIFVTDILTTDLNVTNSANISDDLRVGDELSVGDDLFVFDDTFLYDRLKVYGLSYFYNNVKVYDNLDVYDDATFNTSITLVRSGDSILEVETTGITDSAEIRVLADGTNDLYIYTYGSNATGTYDGLPKANTSLIDARGHRFILGTYDYSPMFLSTHKHVRWDITPVGHFVPHDDEDYDIGNSSYRVRDIYVLGEDSSGGLHFVEDDGSYGNLSMDDSFNLLWNGNIIGNSSFNNSFVASNYVSYNGATKNVTLGSYNISASYFIGDGSQLTGISTTETDPWWGANYSAFNDSWSSTYNSSYASEPIWTSNYSAFNDSWSSTYNSSYASEPIWTSNYSAFNDSWSSTYNSSYLTSYTETDPWWGANYSAFNDSWSSTYNSSYASEPIWTSNYSAFNDSWSSTYNSSYLLNTADTFAGKLTIDQNNDEIGLLIDTEATTAGKYALQISAGQGCQPFYIADSSWSMRMRNIESGTASFHLLRDASSVTTKSPIMLIEQDNTGDDQNVLHLQQDAPAKSLWVDQNGDGVGIHIDSEATTAGKYALQINTGQGANAAYFGADSNNYGMIARHSSAAVATNYFQRDSALATTTAPVFYINQLNAGDDQVTLKLDQAASGIYALEIVGADRGIDMSSFSVDESLIKAPADVITTAGNLSAQIAVDIGGTTYYLYGYTTGS